MRLPGDPPPRQTVGRTIRVDHAGEYGAVRIYTGQLAVLGGGEHGPVLRHMLAQEQRHLAAFEEMIATRRVRPTVLLPVWHVAGFALGAMTAALGARAAMACTVAVEEAIDTHYATQMEKLEPDEAALHGALAEFRAEELEHRDTALARGAEEAVGYRVLAGVIKAGCRVAIALSERL